MRSKKAANPINLKGAEKIIAEPILKAVERFWNGWYNWYSDPEKSSLFADTWESLYPLTRNKLRSWGPTFTENFQDQFYGLHNKAIGEYLKKRGGDISFTGDPKKDSYFKSISIIISPPNKLDEGSYFSTGSKNRVYINFWSILKDMPKDISPNQALRVLKSILVWHIGHELTHALDYTYRADNLKGVYDPDAEAHAYYNSPHELRAYVYNAASEIWEMVLPHNRGIQRFIGKYLWEYLFGEKSGQYKFIAPENRKEFTQRVYKQLMYFQQRWLEEQGKKDSSRIKSTRKKQSGYSEIDEEFLEKEGIDPDDIGWLGGGENGNAYDLGDGRVLKITRSNNEYQKALEVKGKRFSNLIDIYSAEKVGSAYYIIMEDLDMDPQDEALFYETLEILNTQGLPTTYISYFDQEEYEAEYGEISEEVKAFINELETVVSDLRRAGIGDRADIHADNLGRDKNTGALKAFDLMEKD